MNWVNITDSVPAEGVAVLVCIDGVYRVATYHHKARMFEEISTKEYMTIKETPVYWSEIDPTPSRLTNSK